MRHIDGRPWGRRAAVRCAVVALGLVAMLGSAGAAAATEPGGRILGTVTGSGLAVANTWVTLTPVDNRGDPTGAERRTVTDATGRYEFTTLATGPVKLQVRAPLGGTMVDTWWPRAFTFDSAGMFEVSTGSVRADIDLPVGGSAEGQVVDVRTGQPVAGARVTASIDGDRPSNSVGTPRPVAAPGAFLLGALPPVPLELSVSAPQDSPYLDIAAGRPGPGRSARIDGAVSTTGVTIGLRRAAVVTGTVRDDAGAPVVGADVRLVGCSPTCPGHASTDAAGRYRLAGITPGTGLDVVAQPAWGLLGPWYPSREASARITDLDLAEGEVIESVDLTLQRPAFLRLDVLGAGAVDPLRAIVRLTTTGRTYSQYFNDASAVRPGAPSGSGVTSTSAGASPTDPIELTVGPVPPGEYSVTIDLGVADPGYLPTRWVSDTGTPTTPTIRLAGGDANRALASLTSVATRDGKPIRGDAAPVTSEDAAPTGWPGLAQGFLARTGWATLLPSGER
jgi:protocatechuate 3,4-dioxygenase beta subunit